MSTDFTANGTANPPATATETPLAKARRKLALWEDAEDACASGQSYQMSKTMLTRVNLPEIRAQVRYYESKVEQLSRGRGRGARVMRIIPLDN